MEHNPWLLFGLGWLASSVATWGFCHWWYGRRLASNAIRLDKLDKARLFAGQQVMQARKQIEKLQRDIALLQRRPVRATAPPTRAAQVEAVLRSVDQLPSRHDVQANGFADTRTMETSQ